jgi:hypothetical protein
MSLITHPFLCYYFPPFRLWAPLSPPIARPPPTVPFQPYCPSRKNPTPPPPPKYPDCLTRYTVHSTSATVTSLVTLSIITLPFYAFSLSLPSPIPLQLLLHTSIFPRCTLPHTRYPLFFNSLSLSSAILPASISSAAALARKRVHVGICCFP